MHAPHTCTAHVHRARAPRTCTAHVHRARAPRTCMHACAWTWVARAQRAVGADSREDINGRRGIDVKDRHQHEGICECTCHIRVGGCGCGVQGMGVEDHHRHEGMCECALTLTLRDHTVLPAPCTLHPHMAGPGAHPRPLRPHCAPCPLHPAPSYGRSGCSPSPSLSMAAAPRTARKEQKTSACSRPILDLPY